MEVLAGKSIFEDVLSSLGSDTTPHRRDRGGLRRSRLRVKGTNKKGDDKRVPQEPHITPEAFKRPSAL